MRTVLLRTVACGSGQGQRGQHISIDLETRALTRRVGSMRAYCRIYVAVVSTFRRAEVPPGALRRELVSGLFAALAREGGPARIRPADRRPTQRARARAAAYAVLTSTIQTSTSMTKLIFIYA